MRVVHAAGDEQPVKTLKVAVLGHAAPLLGDDKDLVRLDAQGWVVLLAGDGEEVVDNLAEAALLGVGVGVRQIGLEDHDAQHRGIDGWAVVLSHCINIEICSSAKVARCKVE